MPLLITLLIGFLSATAIHSQSLSGILNNFDLLEEEETDFLNGPLSNTTMPDLSSLKNLLSSLQNEQFFKGILSEMAKITNNSRCANNIISMAKELAANKIWPIKFFDATAKIPAGVALGSLTFMGSYDECMSIDNSVDGGNDTIRGQYCPITFSPTDKLLNLIARYISSDIKPGTVSLVIRWDVCVPDACSAELIQDVLDSNITVKLRKLVTPAVQHCQIKDKGPFTSGEITALSIFTILGLFIALGTGLDICLRILNYFNLIAARNDAAIKDHILSKVVISFSYYTNGKKLLNTDMAQGSLTSVNGIRFLSMSWVILGHAYFFINNSIIGNLFDAKDIAEDFFFQAILNATVSVDTFFLLSGLLVAYVGMKALMQSGKLNLGFYYFHRIWRLTPAYAFVILFTLLWPLLGSGPTWYDNNVAMVTNCETHWWSALLYINNLYEPSKMCLGHGWYLANDMQFYVISPIILIAMYKKPKLGFLINLLFLVGTIINTAILGHVYNLPPTALFIGDTDSKLYFSQKAYITPYCRMGPYCIGLYLGYFLANSRTLKIKIRWHAVLWCLAIICNVSVLYGTLNWNSGIMSSVTVNALYLSVHRTVWSLGVAWVLLACCTGHGGIVNSILSWSVFVPLGRMTYLAYLIHPLIQMGFSGLLRERLIYTHYEWVILFLGFLVISYAFAFGASLAVEAPFLALEKLLMAKIKKSSSSTGIIKENPQNSTNGDVPPEGFENKSYEDLEKQKNPHNSTNGDVTAEGFENRTHEDLEKQKIEL